MSCSSWRVRDARHRCSLPTPTGDRTGEIRRCVDCQAYWIGVLDRREPLDGRWRKLTWVERKLRRLS